MVFLDLDDVQSLQGVVQAVCLAEKHADNPVLPLGDMHEWDGMQARPWEGRTQMTAATFPTGSGRGRWRLPRWAMDRDRASTCGPVTARSG